MSITFVVIGIFFVLAALIAAPIVIIIMLSNRANSVLETTAFSLGLRDASASPALMVPYGLGGTGRFRHNAGKAFEGNYRGRSLLTYSYAESQYYHNGHNHSKTFQYVVVKLRNRLPATVVLPHSWRRMLPRPQRDQALVIPSPHSAGWLAHSQDWSFLAALLQPRAPAPWLMLDSYVSRSSFGFGVGFWFHGDDLVLWSNKSASGQELQPLLDATSIVADWLELKPSSPSVTGYRVY